MREKPAPEKVEQLYEKLQEDAAAAGYNLNPDEAFTRDLVEALLINARRYGYQACPCRLASGSRDKDLDIICPCDYRDPDLAEFGTCYCALYVSDEIARGEREASPIPERRPAERKMPPEGGRGREGEGEESPDGATGRLSDSAKDLPYPVWRCPVCGYLCAREHPPEKCPICKADKDRFQRFL